MSTILERQPALVRGLMCPEAYAHPCEEIQLVETHISWVFLTGSYAYKVKKPVDMGFLDFSTLEKRHFYCREELRLNSRHADFYLGVVPIVAGPRVEGEGEPIDYAVKMRQFDPSKLLSLQLKEGQLQAEQIDRLAEETALFHQHVARATSSDGHGTPPQVQAPCIENFDQLDGLLRGAQRKQRLNALRAWTENEYRRLEPLMAARKDRGWVRECHGDLHLGNVTEVEGEVVIFDGIEFNENFRWTDVLNELAFLFTDLEHRGRRDLAWRALNRYLELSGDYGGLRLLRYYRLYRIMVRAKVDAFRLAQPDLDEAELKALEADIDVYLDQGEETVRATRPALVLTRGLSGSGKTYTSQHLLETLGAIRLRSDVERKRLFGLPTEARTGSPVGGGIYTAAATQDTQARLLTCARSVVEAGYPVIVDATFIDTEQIRPFKALAAELDLPFAVLELRAQESVLRNRIARRVDDASEAGQEVLSAQLKRYQPLEGEEVVVVDGAQPARPAHLLQQLRGRFELD